MSSLLMTGTGLAFLFQDDPDAAAAAAGGVVGAIGGLIGLAFAVVIIASLWKIFVKAGEPGWAALVPIYNIIVLLKIIGRPAWWLLLCIIPGVNVIVAFIIAIDLARVFGKGTGFGIGLAVLSLIFYPLLAFGDARYQRPA